MYAEEPADPVRTAVHGHATNIRGGNESETHHGKEGTSGHDRQVDGAHVLRQQSGERVHDEEEAASNVPPVQKMETWNVHNDPVSDGATPERAEPERGRYTRRKREQKREDSVAGAGSEDPEDSPA